MKANCLISLLKNISKRQRKKEKKKLKPKESVRTKFSLINLDLIVQEKNTSEMNKVYSQDSDVSCPSQRCKTRKPTVSQSTMQQIKRVNQRLTHIAITLQFNNIATDFQLNKISIAKQWCSAHTSYYSSWLIVTTDPKQLSSNHKATSYETNQNHS